MSSGTFRASVLVIIVASIATPRAGFANGVNFTFGNPFMDGNGNGIPTAFDPTEPQYHLNSAMNRASGSQGGPGDGNPFAGMSRRGKMGLAIAGAAAAGALLLPVLCEKPYAAEVSLGYTRVRTLSYMEQLKCGVRRIFGMENGTGEENRSSSHSRRPPAQRVRYSYDPRVSQTSLRASKGSAGAFGAAATELTQKAQSASGL